MKRSPNQRRRALTLPLGLFLLLCVLAMHGFQASPSPADATGVPLTAMSAGHHSAPSPSGMAAVDHPAGDDQPGGHHQDHPGGEVFLAILAMISFLGAVLALLCRAPAAVLARRLLARTWSRPVHRPPPRPSLYRLSVLRL